MKCLATSAAVTPVRDTLRPVSARTTNQPAVVARAPQQQEGRSIKAAAALLAAGTAFSLALTPAAQAFEPWRGVEQSWMSKKAIEKKDAYQQQLSVVERLIDQQTTSKSAPAVASLPKSDGKKGVM